MEARTSIEAILIKLRACGEALVRARKSADPAERKVALLEASTFFRAGSALRAELQAKALGQPTLAQYYPESLPPEPPYKSRAWWQARAHRKGGDDVR